jgi:2-polyprenyl-3-methyl-5-hydroxy-6-metoxy-1,4-benzoquinol methylase
MKMENIFNYSGYANKADLENQSYKQLFWKLENEQKHFLDNTVDVLQSSSYPWPVDALHNWSRIWEYPYVYYWLNKLNNENNKSKITIIDYGSGITFFPFLLAKEGYNIRCLDVDERYIPIFNKCSSKLNNIKNKINLEIIKNKIQLSDNSIDIVYSVSVLEHIDNYEMTLNEISRVLKKNGILILTMDVDHTGSLEIGIEKFNKVRSYLKAHYKFEILENFLHPLEALNSINSPFSQFKKFTNIDRFIFSIKQDILKPIFKKKSLLSIYPYHLGIYAAVLRKI